MNKQGMTKIISRVKDEAKLADMGRVAGEIARSNLESLLESNIVRCMPCCAIMDACGRDSDVDKVIFLFILLSVLAVVTWRNYSWSTSLLGWDSVQPELDFGMNLKRALTSVWVVTKGRAYWGHGYATILIQGMIEWVMSLVVGVAQTRGTFIFLCFGWDRWEFIFMEKWFNNTEKFASWEQCYRDCLST